MDRDSASDLAFELANYTGQTLDAMVAWQHQGPALLQLKMEDFVADFDGTPRRAYRHLGVEGPACEALIAQSFEDRYGGLITRLGYQLSGSVSGAAAAA